MHNIRWHLWGNASCRAHRCVCGMQHSNAHFESSHVGKPMLWMMCAWDSCIAWQCMEQLPSVRARQLQAAWHGEIGYTCHAGNRGCQGRKRSRHTQGRGAVMKHTHGHCRLGYMERTHCQSKPCDGHSTLPTCHWAQVSPCADTRSGPGACCFVHGRNAAKASLWGPPDQLYYSCRRRGYASQQ